MKNIKLFEEYFWQTEDNDIANKIIKILKKGIDLNYLIRDNLGDYMYIIKRTETRIDDIDPLGEENWMDDDVIIKVNDTFGIVDYDLFIIKNNQEIKLVTNKAMKIYNMLDKAYKQKLKNKKLDVINSINF